MNCTACELPLTDSEKLGTMDPPLCSHCEESRCFWCGEFVYPVDKALGGGGICHKACHIEMYTDPEDLETPW